MNNPIGVVSCHLQYDSFEHAYQQAVAMGLGAIEWFEGDRTSVSEPTIAPRLAELAVLHGIANSYHAPWMGPWNLPGRPVGEMADMVVDLLHRANRLGAHLMTLHMGNAGAMDRMAAVEGVGRAIARAVPTAAQLQVRIAVENFTRCYGDADLGDSAREMELLFAVADSPQVGFNLDTGHANVTGNLSELLARFGGRLVNTHLHDTDGVTDGHLPPGQGTIQWQPLLAELKRLNYAGPLNMEFPQASGAYPRFISELREA